MMQKDDEASSLLDIDAILPKLQTLHEEYDAELAMTNLSKRKWMLVPRMLCRNLMLLMLASPPATTSARTMSRALPLLVEESSAVAR